jgi:hypothetical protein
MRQVPGEAIALGRYCVNSDLKLTDALAVTLRTRLPVVGLEAS